MRNIYVNSHDLTLIYCNTLFHIPPTLCVFTRPPLTSRTQTSGAPSSIVPDYNHFDPLSPSDTMHRALSLRRMRSSGGEEGTSGAFQPRRLSSIGGYEASGSGASEPATPFFTPSAMVSSPKSIPTTPLQNKRFTLNRASSTGITIAKMAEETSTIEV